MKYLIQISPNPFDFIVVDESDLPAATAGAYYVDEQIQSENTQDLKQEEEAK